MHKKLLLLVVLLGLLGLSPTVSAQDLQGAFIFGSRNLDCETPNQPGTKYTVVHHSGNNCDVHNSLAYPMTGAAPSYGFVVINPGSTDRNCSYQFGPFDDSPNSRNRFGDDCPEQI